MEKNLLQVVLEENKGLKNEADKLKIENGILIREREEEKEENILLKKKIGLQFEIINGLKNEINLKNNEIVFQGDIINLANETMTKTLKKIENMENLLKQLEVYYENKYENDRMVFSDISATFTLNKALLPDIKKNINSFLESRVCYVDINVDTKSKTPNENESE